MLLVAFLIIIHVLLDRCWENMPNKKIKSFLPNIQITSYQVLTFEHAKTNQIPLVVSNGSKFEITKGIRFIFYVLKFRT